jgi:hypothetical protein
MTALEATRFLLAQCPLAGVLILLRIGSTLSGRPSNVWLIYKVISITYEFSFILSAAPVKTSTYLILAFLPLRSGKHRVSGRITWRIYLEDHGWTTISDPPRDCHWLGKLCLAVPNRSASPS